VFQLPTATKRLQRNDFKPYFTISSYSKCAADVWWKNLFYVLVYLHHGGQWSSQGNQCQCQDQGLDLTLKRTTNDTKTIVSQ